MSALRLAALAIALTVPPRVTAAQGQVTTTFSAGASTLLGQQGPLLDASIGFGIGPGKLSLGATGWLSQTGTETYGGRVKRRVAAVGAFLRHSVMGVGSSVELDGTLALSYVRMTVADALSNGEGSPVPEVDRPAQARTGRLTSLDAALTYRLGQRVGLRLTLGGFHHVVYDESGFGARATLGLRFRH